MCCNVSLNQSAFLEIYTIEMKPTSQQHISSGLGAYHNIIEFRIGYHVLSFKWLNSRRVDHHQKWIIKMIVKLDENHTTTIWGIFDLPLKNRIASLYSSERPKPQLFAKSSALSLPFSLPLTLRFVTPFTSVCSASAILKFWPRRFTNQVVRKRVQFNYLFKKSNCINA